MSLKEEFSYNEVEKLYALLEERCSSYIADEDFSSKLKSVYEFAKKKHDTQRRESGEPYVWHPLSVALILTELELDSSSILAAILHDTLEDTLTTHAELEKLVGPTVTDLVEGLTKISKIMFTSCEHRMAENFRKMVLAMAKDLRVVVIKLADRLHNMRTLGALVKEKRIAKAKETLEIYAPLSGRLGLYEWRSELEDLCLKEMKSEVFSEIKKSVSSKKKERDEYISKVKSILEEELKSYGFADIHVFGRSKHFYSIYRKMVDRQLNFEDIHDLFGFRIIVSSVKDCYSALGVIHSMWRPVPGKFKDYIAMPKPNLYQSLHTTVISSQGLHAEIQIRTMDMHRVCEHGIAAHWAYKEKIHASKGIVAEALTAVKPGWLNQILELQHDVEDSEEFLAAVKIDLYDDEIFVFTPKGDVIELGVGATALDFAFALHTFMGLRASGVKINGKMSALKTKLQSGDIVQILTSANQKPNKDWLKFVETAKAKNKIRAFLREEQRKTAYRVGEKLLEKSLKRRGLEKATSDNLLGKDLVRLAKVSSFEELVMGLGYGKLDKNEILDRIALKSEKVEPKKHSKLSSVSPGIEVAGIRQVLTSIAKCCSPLPGDEIVGFVSQGKGVSVHRRGCLRTLGLDSVRKVGVNWIPENSKMYPAFLRVLTREEQGNVFHEVSGAIAASGAYLSQIRFHVTEDKVGVSEIEICVKDSSHLVKTIKAIEGIPYVFLVERKSSDFLSEK